MKLPIAFIERLKEDRPEDYEDIIASFEEEGYHGLRVNTLKISVADFLVIFPFALKPVPWTEDGFYYNPEDAVTKHPFYHAGLYYIQEPSAMSAVATRLPRKGDIALDLCAAPGGKTLQIATATGDERLLVTNDISDKRVKAIVRNVERFGLRNVVILNETPEHIAKTFGPMFDYVLVDAPCSGEGMFRRDPKAVNAWEIYENDVCAEIQQNILSNMPNLITRGGHLTYSTCTFAKAENEEQTNGFLEKNAEFQSEEISDKLCDSLEKGHYTVRLWPHKLKGEGHFIAHMKRKSTEKIMTGENEATQRMNGYLTPLSSEQKLPRGISKEPPEALAAFMAEYLVAPFSGFFKTIKEKIYLLPEVVLPLQGLKIAREGLLLGEMKGKHFVPSQALALALKPGQFKKELELTPESLEVVKYLKCETLHVAHEGKGLHLVTTMGYPLGFCKLSGGTLKNLYPASWRQF